MSGPTVHVVDVVIYEDDKQVHQLTIGYFEDQPYQVMIDTPDGTDRIYEGEVSPR